MQRWSLVKIMAFAVATMMSVVSIPLAAAATVISTPRLVITGAAKPSTKSKVKSLALRNARLFLPHKKDKMVKLK